MGGAGAGAAPGGGLDTASLAAYLRRQGLALDGPLTAAPLPGRAGCHLLRGGGCTFHLQLAVPDGNLTGEDLARQHQLLGRLTAAYPYAPRPLVLGTDAAVLGTPFLLLEPARGTFLGAGPPPGGTPAPALLARLGAGFMDCLAALHAVDVVGLGLRELGTPEGYLERQVRHWGARWARVRRGPLAAMDELAAWLPVHQPPTRGPAVVHNAFRLDNLLLDPWDLTRIVGVAGWEAATVGDPLIDLGNALAAWAEGGDPAALGGTLSRQPGSPDRCALVERYAAASGRPLGNPLFYFVHGLFQAAVRVAESWHDGAPPVALTARATLGLRALERGRVEGLGG